MMDASATSFRPYAEADHDAYVALYHEVHGRPMQEDFFRWKHHHELSRGLDPLIILAIAGGQLVGANSYFPCIAEAGDEQFRGVQSGDSMVAASARGQGIFLRIVKHAFDALPASGYGFIYGFANEQSNPGFMKLGFASSPVRASFRVFRFGEVLGSRIRLPGVRIAGRAVDAAARAVRSTAASPLREHPQTDRALLDLIETSHSDRARIRKGAETLQWRYDQHPSNRYSRLVLESDGRLTASFIIRLDQKANTRSANLMEYHLAQGTDLGAALGHLARHCRNLDLDFMQVWDTGDVTMREACRANRFLRRDTNIFFIVKILDGGPADLADLGRWRVVEGDLDVG